MIRVLGKDEGAVTLEAQEAGTPGDLILGFSRYPTWSTAVVTIEQAEEFAELLQGLIAEARAKLPAPPTDEGASS